jgi:hypothetical protein
MADLRMGVGEVQGTAAHDDVATGNPVLVGGTASASAPASVSADGDAVSAWFDRQGRLMVRHDQTLTAQLAPRTSGGLSVYRLVSAAGTNAASIKASAGQVYGWYLYNTASAMRVVKLYDTASTPTVGTTTPKLTIPIPAGSGANVEYTQGIAFSSGIGIGTTTGIADSDTGAVGANEVVVNLFYA